MSNGKNPLVLMMALSMPGAANALGLGDIHVDSGLNERLAAEIDIVGATALELNDLQVAVANRETFLHYGADRPAFLSSTTFKVTQDGQGRPVLAVRSTESFTEPVVNFLVDLHWRNGEMIRQYTLLLDPADFAAARIRSAALAARVAPAASAAPPAPLALAAPVDPAAPVAAQVAVAASAPSISAPDAPLVPAAPAAAAPVAETPIQTASRRADPPRDQADSSHDEHAGRKTTHIKIGAKATLRGIAWRVGERSESDLQRMMIAIFRANPNAFEGNINRMHRGAVLSIPTRAELAAISKAEAKREVRAQMTAWHSPARTVAAGDAAAAPANAAAIRTSTGTATSPGAAISSGVATSSATAPRSVEATAGAAATPNAASPSSGAAPTSTTAGNGADALDDAALAPRVQSLEHELSDMKGLLDRERDQLVKLQHQAAAADVPAPVVEAPQTDNTAQTAVKSDHPAMVPIMAGLGLLGAAFAGLYFRFRRRVPAPSDSRRDEKAAAPEKVDADDITAVLPQGIQELHNSPAPEAEQLRAPVHTQPAAPAEIRGDVEDDTVEAFVGIDDATHPLLPILSTAAAGRSEIAPSPRQPAAYEPTVNMRVDTANLHADPTRLDYNLLDLDLTAQHVQMPSALNENAIFKERRTNLADVLKLAIEREPDRHDLRMKLLELYYSAASTNRRAFLDVVQKLARDRGNLQGDEWDKIAYMGRQIAGENPLFSEESASDDDLADCA